MPSLGGRCTCCDTEYEKPGKHRQLLINRYVPLALIILGPALANILSLHIFMYPTGLPLALVAILSGSSSSTSTAAPSPKSSGSTLSTAQNKLLLLASRQMTS